MELTCLKKRVAGMSSGLLALALLLLVSCGGDGDDNNPPPVAIEPVKVSGTPTDRGLDRGFDVFAWAPDSSLIAYLAGQVTRASELYASKPDGSTNYAVSPVPLPTNGDVFSFEWSPDSSRLAYLADQDTAGVFELFTSNPDGSDNKNVSRSAAFGTLIVEEYAWAFSSANRDVLVFIARELNGSTFEIYVSIDNGITVDVKKLSDIVISGTQVVDFAISPDGQRVVYKADQQVFGTLELYVVPVEGGIAVNVSRQPDGNILEVRDFEYSWSFDSTIIAFRAFNPVPNTLGNIELFTARPLPNTAERVSRSPNPDGEVRDFAWSPSRLLLAYTLNVIEGTPARVDLFSTRPFNQDNNQLSNTPGTGSIIATVTNFAWSPSSPLVAFVAEVNTVGINELLVADASVVFPTPVSLSRTLQELGQVTDFEWAPNDFRIAYRADQFLDQRFDLLTVVADGSRPPVLVSKLTFDNSEVADFSWAPDGSRIAYRSDQNTVGVYELFTNNAVGTAPRQVSPEISTGQIVLNFSWAPDSSLIAYQSNQDDITKYELYTTRP